jgi:hypothetical protein
MTQTGSASKETHAMDKPIPTPNLLMSAVPKPGYPKPSMVSREEWDAAPGDASRMTTHTIEYITIHHGGVVYDGSEPKKKIKNLQTWGYNEKGWGDVPYHFQIDLDGIIYECRELKYAGDTNTTYDPRGHALPCVMGNYEEQVLSPAQFDALVELTAWLCSEYQVMPGRILGHKDWAQTACPGKNLYPYIADGTIAREVASRLAAAGCLDAPNP